MAKFTLTTSVRRDGVNFKRGDEIELDEATAAKYGELGWLEGTEPKTRRNPKLAAKKSASKTKSGPRAATKAETTDKATGKAENKQAGNVSGDVDAKPVI
ncbi:hypothetical protein [Neorhodopirellula pilleata]|uniref:Uncharacterized protein n=1 Tax=Neorhodopirellula pilleata TaxID=2714738 RepID=A0A5C5ZWU7_9BACT|nr:hypothetical protein [Neorhodopirellula pilleata]TWT91398.1 hypothetical protein Pla100_52480 [Neorhodopirellula pilleata]TWT91447.1 hypothetical protein Pla100_52970 [Neorhodopirellula pilleata]